MNARWAWTIRYRLASLDIGTITWLVLAATVAGLLLVLLILNAQEHQLAAQKAAVTALEQPVTSRNSSAPSASETEALPSPNTWIPVLANLRQLAQQHQVTLVSANHVWETDGGDVLHVTSNWQWRASWNNGTQAIIDWLDATPNLAVTQFRATRGATDDTFVITLETRTWFLRPAAAAVVKP